MTREGDGWRAEVAVRTYRPGDRLAMVSGTDKAIRIVAEAMGDLFVTIWGEEPASTAAAMLKDFEHILQIRTPGIDMGPDANGQTPLLLFSYRTLQQPDVQMTLFGRKVYGADDRLIGFKLHSIVIEDPAVVATSGKAVHLTLIPDATSSEPIAGMVLELTAADLAAVDAYESRHYRRVSTRLASGKTAFVYVDGASGGR